jgi:hypothetical protein
MTSMEVVPCPQPVITHGNTSDITCPDVHGLSAACRVLDVTDIAVHHRNGCMAASGLLFGSGTAAVGLLSV